MDSTPLHKHKRKGKRLIPPLAHAGWTLMSWQNDRLPEMLWASLLLTGQKREIALEQLRQFAFRIRDLDEPDAYSDITLSGLAQIEEPIFARLFQNIVSDAIPRGCLASLLILQQLPGRERWEKLIGAHEVDEAMQGQSLMKAVVETLDQQSETSTDCRWVRVLCKMMGGKFHFPENKAEEIMLFPNAGDPAEVRGGIRANEMMVDGPERKIRAWPEVFWNEVWQRTQCGSPDRDQEHVKAFHEITTTYEIIENVYHELCNHALNNFETTGIEARDETIFGMGLMSVLVADEIVANSTARSVLGRVGLRTIAEIYITLSYLLRIDTEEIWIQFRRFGAGQAKLVKLKAKERAIQPGYLDVETVERVANEDRWEEFLEVQIGHWKNTDLRSMAIESGLKDVYDAYYEWTSSYAHGHWGAIREHCFIHCMNPLHRLHRIPAFPPRTLPDATPDVVLLVDRILDIISNEYPIFPRRIGIYRLAL
jgi:hypothetical protein